MKYFLLVGGVLLLLSGLWTLFHLQWPWPSKRPAMQAGGEQAARRSWDWRGFLYRGLNGVILGGIMLYIAYLMFNK